MDNETTETTKYMVYFTYTVVVDAESPESAEDKAYDIFEKSLRDELHPSDFAMSDAEDVSDWWTD